MYFDEGDENVNSTGRAECLDTSLTMSRWTAAGSSFSSGPTRWEANLVMTPALSVRPSMGLEANYSSRRSGVCVASNGDRGHYDG